MPVRLAAVDGGQRERVTALVDVVGQETMPPEAVERRARVIGTTVQDQRYREPFEPGRRQGQGPADLAPAVLRLEGLVLDSRRLDVRRVGIGAAATESLPHADASGEHAVLDAPEPRARCDDDTGSRDEEPPS